jgi:hypothetical protein
MLSQEPQQDAPKVPPNTISLYGLKRASDDIACLAQQLGAQRIILGGHDWCVIIAWSLETKTHCAKGRFRRLARSAMVPGFDIPRLLCVQYVPSQYPTAHAE